MELNIQITKGSACFEGCLFKNESSQKTTVFRKQSSGPYAQAVLSLKLGSTCKK